MKILAELATAQKCFLKMTESAMNNVNISEAFLQSQMPASSTTGFPFTWNPANSGFPPNGYLSSPMTQGGHNFGNYSSPSSVELNS